MALASKAASRLLLAASLAACGASALASAGPPTIRLSRPDVLPALGRTSTITARLEDPSRAVLEVRFLVNGEPREPFMRNLAAAADTFPLSITPRDARRFSVIVEALGGDGRVLARDSLWILPGQPYKTRIQVRAAPDWSDLIPPESSLRQTPIVLVHPKHPERLTEEERKFGLNRRRFRVVFLVDGKGFGSHLQEILEVFSNYLFETEIIVASIRNPIHVLVAAKLGATRLIDNATLVATAQPDSAAVS